MRYVLQVNGRTAAVDVDPQTPLLTVLQNDLALTGPKFGCGLGQCGACTVLVDGAAVHSCQTPISTVGRRAVTTVEGNAIFDATGVRLRQVPFTPARVRAALARV
jgi:nicotinate dehydrogenase subunit A